jgi:deoxyribodipyrimidine photo-lyase
MKVSVFWFRRDLRLEDNTALHQALTSGLPVLHLFIFDENILKELPKNDARVSFIYKTLSEINKKLNQKGSSLLCLKGDPEKVFEELTDRFEIARVYTNKDYEPYAIERDSTIKTELGKKGIQFHSYKDQVIFEESEIVKDDGKPYTVFTPYKNKWLKRFHSEPAKPITSTPFDNFFPSPFSFPKLSEIGFESSSIKVRDFDLSNLNTYSENRNLPAKDSTTYLSTHLRFGTISPRQVIAELTKSDETFLSELIWREFFMQILFHFPKVVNHNFKSKYDGIKWRNNEEEFEKWCAGKTGYPMVDAGMRQLNQTGFMHNRVRMITAGFLCKHLLIDWRWGEAYFAEKLLDYELSSNNGNWQWAAGTGCDAAPYFRIFNPIEQLKKFDKDLVYVKRWIPEFGSSDYPQPMVEHKMARIRALETYQLGLAKTF